MIMMFLFQLFCFCVCGCGCCHHCDLLLIVLTFMLMDCLSVRKPFVDCVDWVPFKCSLMESYDNRCLTLQVGGVKLLNESSLSDHLGTVSNPLSPSSPGCLIDHLLPFQILCLLLLWMPYPENEASLFFQWQGHFPKIADFCDDCPCPLRPCLF
jgi:hypothetical protein